MTKRSLLISILGFSILFSTGCGGGIPIRLTIDEFTFPFSVDEIAAEATGNLTSGGSLPGGITTLPELWPQSLPAIKFHTVYTVPSQAVDIQSLMDDNGVDSGLIEKAIKRIELNQLIVRVETSSLSIALPPLKLQLADKKDANANERLAWQTIGTLPGADPGEVVDLPFTFSPSGESLLSQQLTDEERAFALRVQADIDIDTDKNPRLPAGAATLRLILVSTFFVDPEGALGSLESLSGGTAPTSSP